MSKLHPVQRATDSALESVIEPLASYICATEQPKAALRSALAVLYRAVEETNRVANAHFGIFSENR
jgi:hypothetical protein